MLGHVRSSEADDASLVARCIAGNYQEQFLTVAKEDAGLTPMETMDTIASEAMIQDANLTVSQFKLVRQHVTFEAGNSFNMRYDRPVFDELEGAQSGPVPIFGVYKNENEDGSVKHCKHWSTLIGDEASYAVENQILNRSNNTKPTATGSLFPEELVDHGQGAMRGFAKFLLTSKQLWKEKNDLSYGCPIAKICHVQCKKDTFRVIEHTVSKKIVESITHLQKSRLVVVSNTSPDIVQAVYVPREARDFRINEENRLEYKMECESETITVNKELNTEFHGLPRDTLLIDSSIEHFKIYITGDLAFYLLCADAWQTQQRKQLMHLVRFSKEMVRVPCRRS